MRIRIPIKDYLKDNLSEHLQNPGAAYYYARKIINQRFPLGEEAISKSSDYSYYYAAEILKKDFY